MVCHESAGLGGTHGGSKLTRALTNDGTLSADQLQDVASYVLQIAAQDSPP